MIIHSLFPTPVYCSRLNRQLTKKELKAVEKFKGDLYKNEGNFTSNNTYILNMPVFKQLKNDLMFFVNDYFLKIVETSNEITPYITQSWLNYTKESEFHHTHEHPNSFLSAVFYINADEENDKIKFYKSGYNQMKLIVKNFNIFNSASWSFSVAENNILIFPSHLSHCVEFKKGKNICQNAPFQYATLPLQTNCYLFVPPVL